MRNYSILVHFFFRPNPICSPLNIKLDWRVQIIENLQPLFMKSVRREKVVSSDSLQKFLLFRESSNKIKIHAQSHISKPAFISVSKIYHLQTAIILFAQYYELLQIFAALFREFEFIYV